VNEEAITVDGDEHQMTEEDREADREGSLELEACRNSRSVNSENCFVATLLRVDGGFQHSKHQEGGHNNLSPLPFRTMCQPLRVAHSSCPYAGFRTRAFHSW